MALERQETNLFRLHAGSTSLLWETVEDMGKTIPVSLTEIPKTHMGVSTKIGKKLPFEPQADNSAATKDVHATNNVFDLVAFVRENREELFPPTDTHQGTILDIALSGGTYNQIAKNTRLSTRDLEAKINVIRNTLTNSGVFEQNGLLELSEFGDRGLTIKHLASLARQGEFDARKFLFKWYTTAMAFEKFEQVREANRRKVIIPPEHIAPFTRIRGRHVTFDKLDTYLTPSQLLKF